MKIGLLTQKIDTKRAGIGNYAYNLLTNFSNSHQKYPRHQITIIHNKKTADPIYQKYAQLIPNIPKFPFSRTVNELFFLPNLLEKKGFDLIHSTQFHQSLAVKRKYRTVLTIHDLAPLRYPQTHQAMTVFQHKFLLKKTCINSEKIIAVSHSTKNGIIKLLKISPEKIIVIPLASRSGFSPRSKQKIIQVKQKYGLLNPDQGYQYLLSVGTLEPRKNLLRLIKAFHLAKKQTANQLREVKLVICGQRGWKYQPIFDLIKKLHLQKEIKFIGYVPDQDLARLYSGALCLAYPSVYEGFGLPLLEAMSCSCPVMTSNVSSMPEVAGKAAYLVDPFSISEISQALIALSTSEKLRKALKRKGLARVKNFSWQRTAQQTLDVYDQI